MEVTQTTGPGDHPIPPKRGICLINDLPPELLSRIFEFGCASGGFHSDRGSRFGFGMMDLRRELGADKYDYDELYGFLEERYYMWPYQFRALVPQVCSLWHSVVLSTPSLWTYIAVLHNARPPYWRISWLLERSANHPIDIDLYCHRSSNRVRREIPSEADFRFLLDMLIPHFHRWRTIRLTVSDSHYMRSFLNAIADPSIRIASRLTDLHLNYIGHLEDGSPGFSYSSMSKHLPIFGGSAPLLTSLRLWGVHVDWNQPWTTSAANLKDLELAFHAESVRPSWAQFATILRGTSSLQRLSLRQSGPSGDPSEWFIRPETASSADLNAPIQLPRVTGLILAFHSPVRAIGLIRKLYLPALEKLTLDLFDGDYTDFVHELTGPATSLPPSQKHTDSRLSRLSSLRIANLRCRNECASMLYSKLQNLTLLNISLRDLPITFLDVLVVSCTSSGCGDIWLPRLDTLCVTCAPWDVLRAVVHTRKEAGVPLHSLFLGSFRGNWEKRKWLQENVKMVSFCRSSN